MRAWLVRIELDRRRLDRRPDDMNGATRTCRTYAMPIREPDRRVDVGDFEDEHRALRDQAGIRVDSPKGQGAIVDPDTYRLRGREGHLGHRCRDPRAGHYADRYCDAAADSCTNESGVRGKRFVVNRRKAFPVDSEHVG